MVTPGLWPRPRRGHSPVFSRRGVCLSPPLPWVGEGRKSAACFQGVVMPIRRTLSLLTLVCLGTALLRADEVRTLDNKTVTGTVVEVTDKEIAVKTEGGTVVKTPLNEVL